LRELISDLGHSIIGYGLNPNENQDLRNMEGVWTDDFLLEANLLAANVACGIGWPKPLSVKCELMQRFIEHGYIAPALVHPQSYLSPSSRIDSGVQLYPGSVVLAETVIGSWGVVSAGSIVEHGSILGQNVFLGPGTTVCGEVVIGTNSFIGAGVTISNGVNIGMNCIVGAGSLVLDDLPAGGTYFGTPARLRGMK